MKKKLYSLLFVILVFVLLPLIVISPIKAKISVDHAILIANHQETVKKNPNSISAHCALADAYVDQYISTGKTNKLLMFRAKKAIKKAKTIDAKSALPEISWANYFQAMGNKELALKHAKNAAAIAPENKAVKRLFVELEATPAATIKSNKEIKAKEQPVIAGKTQSGMTATSDVPAVAVTGIVKSAAELDVTPVQSATDQQALLVWRGINDSTRPVDFELFLKQYGSSPFAGFARERLKELRLGGQMQNHFVKQLANCKAHLQANRLTSGAGGTALDCYRAVLKEDPNNKQALSGIDQIAEKYVQWIENAISQNNERNARRYIEKLSIVKPAHPQIVSYNEKVDSLSAARQKAKTQSGKSKQATLRQGHGNYTLPDGTRYVGNFKDGNFNGQGTKTWPSGNKYVGEWKDDKRDGTGTYTWPSGNKYVGEWKNDKRGGTGTFTWPSGNKYVGEWKDDKRGGTGTFTWPKGIKYVGQWKDDKRHGIGTYTWPDGTRYVGNSKDGNFNGRGTKTWPNGNKYVGEWKDDKRHGIGTYTWPNGDKYVGAYENGSESGGWYYYKSSGQKIWSYKDSNRKWVNQTSKP